MITKEQYLTMKATWASTKYHTAAEHVLYNILRRKDGTLGFTPIAAHNHDKITSNENNPWYGLMKACQVARNDMLWGLPHTIHPFHISVHMRHWQCSKEEAVAHFQQREDNLNEQKKLKFERVFGFIPSDEVLEAIRANVISLSK